MENGFHKLWSLKLRITSQGTVPLESLCYQRNTITINFYRIFPWQLSSTIHERHLEFKLGTSLEAFSGQLWISENSIFPSVLKLPPFRDFKNFMYAEQWRIGSQKPRYLPFWNHVLKWLLSFYKSRRKNNPCQHKPLLDQLYFKT